MSESRNFDATIIPAGAYTDLKQPIRYARGRAVAYQCPRCHDWHPLHPRDRDVASGTYVGRDCGAPVQVRANSPAGRRAAERARFPSDEAHRAWRREYNRRGRAERAEATRRAAGGGPKSGLATAD